MIRCPEALPAGGSVPDTGAPLELHKSGIRSAVVGGTWKYRYMHYPTITILISDPFGVEESLELTFASTDGNNPHYWIKALTKILREHLEIQIYEAEPSAESADNLPF